MPVDRFGYGGDLRHDVGTVTSRLNHGDDATQLSLRALGALRAWRERVPHLDLAEALSARAVVWFHLAATRVALGEGRVGDANASADAALARAKCGDLTSDEGACRPCGCAECGRAGTQARWMAGHPHDAVVLGMEALTQAWTVAEPLLSAGARVTPAWASRTLTQLATAVSDHANRLEASGNTDEATSVRDHCAERLSTRLGTLGDTGREALAAVAADEPLDEQTPPQMATLSWAPLDVREALLPPPHDVDQPETTETVAPDPELVEATVDADSAQPTLTAPQPPAEEVPRKRRGWFGAWRSRD